MRCFKISTSVRVEMKNTSDLICILFLFPIIMISVIRGIYLDVKVDEKNVY